MKVKINSKIIVDGDVLEYQKLGILENEEVLKFKENDSMVLLNLKEDWMMRESESLRFRYNFIETVETLNDVFIKEYHQVIPLRILTKKIEKKNNNYYVCYHLLEEGKDVEYIVGWEEVV